MQTSLQTMANAAGKFWTHAKVEHAQGANFTSLYLANTGGGGLWVRGKRVWFGSGERENLFWGAYLGSFGENVLLG